MTSMIPPQTEQPLDAEYWARRASGLQLAAVPSGAINLNVEGRKAIGPLQGFGPLWQKTYRVRLSGVTVAPRRVIQVWKERFPKFWPKGHRFYGSLGGMAPGEVALLNLSVAGRMPLSTGVLVLYADDESFTFATPQGHMFAGWLTFSAYEEEGCTVAQVQALIRTNDPLYELAFRLGAGKDEDAFWQQTLRALAAHFGIQGQVQTHFVCIDPRMQWARAKNIWHNAAIRTTFYLPVVLLRWSARKLRAGWRRKPAARRDTF
jgi:hypothetical protein